jgi:UDP-N-acetylmuramate dehydrogenase
MYVLENVPLSGYSTMRLGGTARYVSDITERSQIPEAVAWAEQHQVPILMIGGGSNIVWRDEGFPGLLLVNKIERSETVDFDEQTAYVTIGGGENWDQTVGRTVEAGLSGLELLSLIPGTAGAAPVQNIGAYGAQLSDVLLTIEAYDLKTRGFVMLRASDCAFGYRTSRFKTTDRSRFFITAITVQLTKSPPDKDHYHALESYLAEHNIADRSAAAIRQAVIAIRSSKLPDPALVPNNGSFFANPIITKEHLNQILETYPKLAAWPSKFMWEQPDGRVKVAAAALLEHEGFKGYHDQTTGMATWDKQALVLVNEHATHTADLLAFEQKILDAIRTKFNIELEQEPELLP